MWTWAIRLGGWLIRLIGGWLPIGSKPFGEWIGKIIWVSGILGIGLFVYHKFTAPTTQNNQKAGTIINHYHTPKSWFGCSNTRVMEYYQQETKPKEQKH